MTEPTIILEDVDFDGTEGNHVQVLKKITSEMITSQITVGNLGTTKISVPVITIGHGQPVVTIMAGLHGDEKVGAAVIHELLKDLDVKKGTVRILPVVNVLGQPFNRRENPTDHIDMNRAAPGKKGGSIAERLVANVIELIQDSKLLIDLHNFEMESPLIAAFVDTGDETSKKCLELVKCIHPDFIWHVDLREEQKYDNMIGGYLMGKGTMYLPLETKELAWNGSEEITREANAIKRVLARLGVIEGDSSAGFSPMYKRFPITADDAGLFLPKKKIMTVVQEGDVIAEIVDLSTLTTSEVRVKRSGMLIQIRRKDIVTTGQDIYAIGVDSRNQ